MSSLEYNITNSNTEENDILKCTVSSGNLAICECIIYTDTSHKIWTISAISIRKGYESYRYISFAIKHLIDELFKIFGKPEKIKYIQNGRNHYTLNWLNKNFKTKCINNYSISYIYDINTENFINYFIKRKDS